MRRRSQLPLSHALALGALHGPTELLPISSSGHTTLVPWLLGWPYPELDAEYRKAFEAALHAGTAAGLLVGLRDEVGEALCDLDRRRIALVACSFASPAVAGLTLERQIERRFGTPRTIAVGLLVGSAAMLFADRTPAHRRRSDAGALDGLLLGVAQAAALIPGVSRNGATLAAARARGFSRADANDLSRHVALPIIVGATVLKGKRLARRGLARPLRASFAVGTAAAFASTLASTWIVRRASGGQALAPYAAYRAGLALCTLARGGG
jgi:undecaprenyl-diphosphatase